MHLVDEENGLGARRQRRDDHLEAFLEVAAEARAGQQGAGVQREDLGSSQCALHIVVQQARGQPFGQRRLADAGVADEDRVVLAAAAEDLDRALQFGGAADERVELPLPGAVREVDAVGAQRIGGGGGGLVAVRVGTLVVAARRACRIVRHLGDAVRDEVEDVEPRDVVLAEQLSGVGLRLLQHRGNDVAGVCHVALRALHMQDGGLQHAAECHRLLRVLRGATLLLFDRLVEILVEVAAQLWQVDTAGGENGFTVRIVRQGVEQVFQRQVRVTARDGLAERDVQDDFERR